MSDFLYTVTTLIAPEAEKEFNVWQETEHCPLLLTIPGYHSVIRYKDMQEPCRYINFWHIESKRSFDMPERLVKARTPWANWLMPYRKMQLDFYVQKDWETVPDRSIELEKSFTTLFVYEISRHADKKEELLSCFDDLYRKAAGNIKGVMDVKLYSAFGVNAQTEHLIFHYLEGKPEELLKTCIPELENLMKKRQNDIVRRIYRCISKHEAGENHEI